MLACDVPVVKLSAPDETHLVPESKIAPSGALLVDPTTFPRDTRPLSETRLMKPFKVVNVVDPTTCVSPTNTILSIDPELVDTETAPRTLKPTPVTLSKPTKPEVVVTDSDPTFASPSSTTELTVEPEDCVEIETSTAKN